MLIVGAAALNWLVDPYGIFGSPVVSGYTDLKPEYDRHLALAKTVAVDILKPHTIILGSSRANEGLDPNHPGFYQTKNHAPVYNLAIDGGNIYMAMRLFQHAQATTRLEMVVLAVDFFMFNAYLAERPDFDENFLRVGPDGSQRRFTHLRLLPLVVSLDTTVSSAKTIWRQSANNIQPYGPLGPRRDGYRASEIAKRGGMGQEFNLSEEASICYQYRAGAAMRYSFANARTHRNTLESFRKIVSQALKDNVRLIVIISPSHARDLESVNAAGLWGKFEEWKRSLVKIVDEEELKAKHRAVALWDFTGYEGPVAEEVPAEGDTKTLMQFYWESSHYTKLLGDRALDRVLADKPASEGLGTRLTTETVNSHLAEIRGQQHRWQLSHRQEQERFAAIVRKCGKIPTEPTAPVNGFAQNQ